MRKGSLLAVMLLLASVIVKAQNSEPAMADGLRAEGKIYVVVLVLATIFAGIIALLVRMDRKISKLEKK
jgi:undecaprenyl pyrophosphate phosphatase UppP